jgi:glycosyltransferase involved in cell wall biosynthesis
VADAPRVAVLARAAQPLHGVGGLERHVHDLVSHLVRRGSSVTLVTRPATVAGADAGDAAALFGVDPRLFRLIIAPYVTFPGAGRRGTTIIDRSTAYPLFGWRAGRIAIRLARRGDVDIVHALGASGLGYATARRRHEHTVPFVFNPQGLEEFGGTLPRMPTLKRVGYTPLQAAVRVCASAADVVLATDRSLVDTVQRHLGIDHARIETVPNAVDLEAIDRARAAADPAAVRAAAGIGPDDVVILSVGRLEANKGFHVLAEALGRLTARAAAPPWRWVLVGDGPHRSVIERAAQDAAMGPRLTLTGRLSDADLSSWYEAADLFVHPTLYEGSSLVTLEAMARETAVVATRAGGLPDKVVPDVTGWLVDPGDPAALADALVDALASGEERQRRGAAGRALVEQEFSWPAVTDRLLAIYRVLRSRESESRGR